VLVNTSPIPAYALDVYAKYHEFPIVDDLQTQQKYLIIRTDLISSHIIKKSNTDTLIRSLIRHDSDKLGTALMKCIGDEGDL